MRRYIMRCPTCGTTWQTVGAYGLMQTHGYECYRCSCYLEKYHGAYAPPPEIVDTISQEVVAHPSTYDDLRGLLRVLCR